MRDLQFFVCLVCREILLIIVRCDMSVIVFLPGDTLHFQCDMFVLRVSVRV